ncbi:MAG TPA: formate dehydrogenase accessory protein FdhE [Candidatus Methylomirabilis sp.]|jgi:FdhE protein|nr:formate dehydrogenase accessory protein FdhE [Candidatus Methylomirabilis sp.]
MLREYPWENVVRALELLKRRRPPLGELLSFHGQVLEAQHQTVAEIDVGALAGPEALGRLREGAPVAAPAALPVDWAATEALFWRLAPLMQARAGAPAGAVAQSLKSGECGLRDLVQDWLAGGEEVARLTDAHGLPEALLPFWLQASLRPSLEAVAARLQPLAEEAEWSRGLCPVCGSPPATAEHRGQDTTAHRYLHCGLCGCQWRFRRGECPFCGNRDHQRLILLFDEADKRCQLEACRACRRALKLIDNKDFFGLIPWLEDLGSPHLELIAAERGFSMAPVRPGEPEPGPAVTPGPGGRERGEG